MISPAGQFPGDGPWGQNGRRTPTDRASRGNWRNPRNSTPNPFSHQSDRDDLLENTMKEIICRRSADGVSISDVRSLSVISQQGGRVIAILCRALLHEMPGGQPLHMSSAIALASRRSKSKANHDRVLRDGPAFEMSGICRREIFNSAIWSISCSTRASGGWRACSCCCQLWQGGEVRGGHAPDQPGTLGGKSGDDSLPHQLLHEQIPQAWPHRIQRPPEGTHRASECRRPRLVPALARPLIQNHLPGGRPNSASGLTQAIEEPSRSGAKGNSSSSTQLHTISMIAPTWSSVTTWAVYIASGERLLERRAHRVRRNRNLRTEVQG